MRARWLADAKAPGLNEIEALALDAFARLPAEFRALCAGVRIVVEDFPDSETLAEMRCESEFDLLGLFRGIGLAQSGEVVTGQMPNAVWLYRRPLLDYWAEYDETLGHLVTHVLVHEIGHHFGLSDADMEALEAAADA
ncbi:metallopeptidase family protein [Methylobacterium nigriterrae]|uniref:metallopeptidase family protein n=1 Tax=Methylobacterium nigriterrae TaxID=3127512 RepID=UPI0030140FB9